MIDLSKYRIIDLSYELFPGEMKVDGHYLHGQPFYGRATEVQEFFAYGARMHFIQTQTHLGTHAECDYKFFDAGAEFPDMPLSSFMGEAVACNLSHVGAGEVVTLANMQRFYIKAGDIVLIWGKAGLQPWPYLAPEALNWLIGLKPKMVCNDNVLLSPPGTPYGPAFCDHKMISAGITIVDAVTGLDQITKPRVFFMGLPIKMRRITACPVRAVALEEIG
jgi:arylformamidase